MFNFKTSKNKFENTIPLNKRIHPGIKFFAFIISIIFIFLINSIFTQIIFALLLLSFYFMCRINKKNLKLIMKSFVLMFLIFSIINWFFYKNPIAFDINGFNWLGNPSILNKYDWFSHSNGIYVSNIWGGNILNSISQDMVDHFATHNMKEIDRWFRINNVNIDNLTNIPNNLNLTTLEAKKAFLYLMNNKFVFEGVKYNIHSVSSIINNSSVTYDIKYVVIYNVNWYTLSPTAITKAAYISLKILSILLASSMLTETTTSIELSSGIETMLSPLKIIKFPVDEAATIIAIAIRFIPSLLSESKRILNAQASRGLDFKNGNILIKLKSLVSLVVPLFSIAFKNSEELANAMDARGYNPKAIRTKYRIFKFSLYDFCLLFLISFFGVFGALFNYLNIFFIPFGIVEGDLIV